MSRRLLSYVCALAGDWAAGSPVSRAGCAATPPNSCFTRPMAVLAAMTTPEEVSK